MSFHLPASPESLYAYEDVAGALWTGNGSEIIGWPSPASLIHYAATMRFDSVRVCGHRRQTMLVLSLLGARDNTLLHRVELCTPRVCLLDGEEQDYVLTIRRMQACQLPTSVGGWHVAGPADAVSYQLAYQLELCGWSEAALCLLRDHPAWLAMSFVPEVDTESAACVITDLLDPRWFVDPQRPSRCSRLFNYFGLDPRTVELALSGSDNVRAERCRRVVGIWYGSVGQDCFLKDIYLWHGGGFRGIMRASQCLLTFVRSVWLAAVSWHEEMQFVPERFFRGGEAARFRQHLSNGGRS